VPQNPDWTFVVFDMSRQQLMWFARAFADKKKRLPLGERMLLTRREAIAGFGGGLSTKRDSCPK
jgi:hypothetical protein